LLNDTARRELEALYMYFDDGSTELRAPPRVLEALADKVSMHKRFLRERDVTHAKFAPIKAQVSISQLQIQTLFTAPDGRDAVCSTIRKSAPPIPDVHITKD